MKNPISLNESDVRIKTDIKNFSKNDYGFKKYERTGELDFDLRFVSSSMKHRERIDHDPSENERD